MVQLWLKGYKLILLMKQFELLQKLKGELGSSNSEVVKNITIAWLIEKSFISTTLKTKIFSE